MIKAGDLPKTLSVCNKEVIAIAKIDFQIEAFSKAGQRPARTQPKAERERCLGLRTI